MAGPDITFKSFEIINIVFNISIVILLLFSIIKSHHGDCRGAVVSKTQNPDGQCVTREAKLSIHEAAHDYEFEQFLQSNVLLSSHKMLIYVENI